MCVCVRGSPQRSGVLQAGPGVGSVVVPEGRVAVAAPWWSWRPLQVLIGAATERRAPYGTHAVSVRSRNATAVSTVTDSTSYNQRKPTFFPRFRRNPSGVSTPGQTRYLAGLDRDRASWDGRQSSAPGPDAAGRRKAAERDARRPAASLRCRLSGRRPPGSRSAVG